jgi:hypothetical protein
MAFIRARNKLHRLHYPTYVNRVTLRWQDIRIWASRSCGNYTANNSILFTEVRAEENVVFCDVSYSDDYGPCI